MKKIILLITIFVSALPLAAQNSSSKSNELTFDFSDAKKYNSSLPSITWTSPQNETSFIKDGRISLVASIASKDPLKSVKLVIREKDHTEARGQVSLPISAENNRSYKINKTLVLLDGVNEIEIIAENVDGLISSTFREVHVGATVLADAAKLGRTDYALIFVTDKYDNWTPLVNPVYDGRTIADDLQKTFGFKTDVVENPTQDQVFNKLREYAEKKYGALDQLFIFFAGHGFYDDTFKEGFVVAKESLPEDPARTSFMPHSRLKSTIGNNPCQHILLVMDVCFGGTFDDDVASRSVDETYKEASQSEMVIRKLQYKTRKYITSGGKEYVSDGIAGMHSPFAKEFIAALETQGGNDGILTLSELLTYLEKLKTAPQVGKFGADQLGSEFVFVVK